MYKHLFFAGILFMGIFLAVKSQCPTGWSTRPKDRSWCYLFVNGSRAKNWNDAKAACEAKKAQLIKVDSVSLKAWLTDETNKRIKIDPYNRRWWVGLNKLADKKNWKWTDKSGLNTKAIGWYSGNPNNVKYQFCASLYNYKTVGLTDETCSYSIPYICQRRTNIPLYCDGDNGWESADGTCYKYMDYRRSWFDAQKSCENLGADLAAVVDDTDATIVSDHARENKRDVWIGLKSIPDPSTRYAWRWANGTAAGPSKYWHPPVTVPQGQENSSCGAVSSTIKSAQSWVVGSCYDEKMYVCEKPEGSCAPGWKSFGAYCYQFNTQFSMSFDSAMRHCQAQSARLAEIYTDDTQQFINQYLPGIRAAGQGTIWIGIYDRNWDVYKFTSGRAIGPYTNWIKKNPPNQQGVQECVYINTGDRLGRWNPTKNCLLQKPFICFASSRTVTRPVTTPPPRVICPSGYSVTGTNCFRWFDQAATWLDARAACQKNGGDLAIITDDDTQVYVQGRVRADKWIGLNDRQHEGTWAWLDQSSATSYVHWSPDKSVNSGGQNCVVMQGSNDRRGKWLDKSCAEKHGYICQKDSLTFATTPAVPSTTTSWTANCGPFWEEHSALGNCYQFRSEQYTFQNARQMCQQQGGDLASIRSLAEQNYIEARIKGLTSGSYWIGATDESSEGGWMWADGSAFSFLNWAAGQPDDFNNNQDCGRVIASSGMWDDDGCFARYGFICKKASKAATQSPATTPVTAPAGKYLGCPSGFTSYQNKCYMFKKQTGSWQTALSYCRLHGGDLVSVQSKAENNYISTKTRTYGGGVWIGLNDQKNQMNFEWSDDSPVVYTNWAKGEPNNYHGAREDCVALRGWGWLDYVCADNSVKGFVCEARQYVMPKTTRSPMLNGCSYGALGYYGSCYQFVARRYTWAAAEKYCTSKKGHLVTINDRYVQSFVSSELASRAGNWWIGLSDTSRPGRVRWSSGSRIYYTNWDRKHSGKEKATCIAVTTSRPVGLWSNRKCTERNQFVCEYSRKGFTNPPTTTRPTVQPNCPAEWNEFNGYCYKGYYAYETHLRKTWTEARDYCRAYGADLASIHSDDEEQFILSTVLKFMKYLQPGTYWIGMNDRAVQEGYEWSDGTPNDYVNWADNQPNNHNNQEDCVEFNKDSVKWNDAICALSKNFICKIKKGLRVRTTINPQTFTNPATCTSSGWYSYNNTCYYYSYYGQEMTWYDARNYCLKNGGELASIHTKEENDFVISLISKLYRTDYWIGLNELNLKSYEWTDGTPLDYKNWAPREPNDMYGGERCVNTFNYNGQWNDNNCAQKLNFICKRPDGKHPAQTLAPTPVTKGGCPSGFTALGPWSSKCFTMASDFTLLNWTSARTACQKKYAHSDLASIASYREMQVLVSMLNGRKNMIWIGLNDIQTENRFVWTDNSNVKFTFWDRGEPNGVAKTAKSGQIEDCVQIYPQYWKAGRWSDAKCSLRASFVCEAFKSPSIPIPRASPQPPFCQKPGYVGYGDNCYKIDSTPRTWQAANTFCTQNGGNLVSITSVYEQALLQVMLIGKSSIYWIGLSDNQNSGQYSWTDGWPILYTHWSRKEPSKLDGEGCVAMMSNSRWNDTLCVNKYPAICKISIASKPETTPLAMHRPCAVRQWIPSSVNNYCYYYEVRSLQSWSGAEYQCKRRNMHLVTITSKQDQDFITSIMSQNKNPYVNLWIGLAAADDGGFMWRDVKFADGYTNWAPSEPSNQVSSYDEDCVEMNPVTGKWYDQACSSKRGYICWAPKLTSTTLAPITQQPVTPKRLTVGPVNLRTTPRRITQAPITFQPQTKRTLNPLVTLRSQTSSTRGRFTTRPINRTPLPLGQQGNNSSGGGLGPGAIAGIVIAVVLIVAALVGAGLLIHFKQGAIFNFQQRQRHSSSINKGFDNALYSKSSDTVNVN